MTRKKRSLALKLVLVVVATVSLVGISTTALVAGMNLRDSKRALERTEVQIRDSLRTKGKILSENHALALRNLVLDNAFSDVSRLVHGAVREDPDVVYGLFLGADGVAWAYASPTTGDREERSGHERWKELGIDATVPAAMAIRETELFGQKIQEFAVPVLEGEDVLGTIRYGLSTARVEHELASAQAEAQAALREALLLWTGLCGFSCALGMVLARRFARRITTPLAQLTQTATRVASGDRGIRAAIKSGDEIEVLGDAFDQMVSELAASNEELAALNVSLEDKVRARTAELASRNRELRLIMDNAQQGFLTVFADGRMAEQRSSSIDRLLGESTPGESYLDYVRRADPEYARFFALTLVAIEEDMIPRDVCVLQLPTRAKVGEKVLSFTYVDLSVDEDAEFGGLLVVVEDVTEQLARERHQREQAEALSVYRRIIVDRDDFEAFVAEMSAQIRAVCAGELGDDVEQFKRTLHTVKGSLALSGLDLIAGICHELERDVDERHALPAPERTQLLSRRWDEILALAAVFLGPRDGVSITRNEYERLLATLEGAGLEDALRRAHGWRLEPVAQQLGRLKDQARALAEQLGRGHVEVEVECDETRLDRHTWAPFWQSMAHVVRNSVDHGLYELKELPAGHAGSKLTLAARHEDERFVVTVADNGRGIDWNAVRSQARARGLPHETHEDLIAALFADGLTTRARVSAVSGRGLGMSAVRRTTEQFGGSISVESAPGRGTALRVAFPALSLLLGADEGRRVAELAGAPEMDRVRA